MVSTNRQPYARLTIIVSFDERTDVLDDEELASMIVNLRAGGNIETAELETFKPLKRDLKKEF